MRKNILGYLLSIIVLNFYISSTNNHLYGTMLINTNDVLTSINSNSNINKNTTQYKRDLIHSQEAWIHEYSQKNDVVTWIQFNPDSLRYSRIPTITGTPVYSIYRDPSGIFIMDDNLLKINDISNLETNVTYKVEVLCEVQDMWDIAEISVYSVDADKIKYVDFSNSENGDGSWNTPFNKPIIQMQPNTYYFYRRGSSYEPQGKTIFFAKNSAMVAYGQGGRPKITLEDSDSDDYGILIDGVDNCLISNIELTCNGVSRAIQINSKGGSMNSNTKIIGCRINYAGIGIRSDEPANNLEIIDNFIYESGDDALSLELQYSKILGNIIKGVSRTSSTGDGIHLTLTNYKNIISHNYIHMGSYYTEKAIILNRAKYDSDEGMHGDTTMNIIEHNNLHAGTSKSVRGGINCFGIGDTIRYNYVYEGDGIAVAQSAAGIENRFGSGIYHHNITDGWVRGIELNSQGGKVHKVYNNIILNATNGIYIEDNDYSVEIYNNIIKDAGNKHYFLFSTNGETELDYNIHWNENSDLYRFQVNGEIYEDFYTLQNKGYNKNGFCSQPQYAESYIPLSSGNLVNKGKVVNIKYDFLGNKIDNSPDIGIIELTDEQSSAITSNTAPIIQAQTFNMADTLTQGLSFAKIIANETDEGQTFSFKILSGNSDNTFSVDSNSGNIIYNGNPRIDEIGNFLLRIAVTDNGEPSLTSEADIRINIEHITADNSDSGNKSGETVDNTATKKITTFYIDPENANDSDEDGSKDHPFDSWTDITWTDNSTYLQKKGTISYIEKLLITANNVIIGSYGENEQKPVIVSNTKEYAIKAYDKKNITITGLNIKAEEAVGSVYFLGAEVDSIVVEKCTFSNSVFGLRIMEGKNYTIRYNTFNNNYTAVHSTAEFTSIYYNIFKSNDMSINLMSYLSNSEVYNNTFYDNSIAISTSYGSLSMYNNIFYLANDNDVALQSTQSQLFSDYNLFYPENDGFINIGDTLYNTLQSFQASRKLDLSSLNSDPLFVDMYNDNFMVSSQSPAIEKGKLFGELTDFFGSTVPSGDYPDIGAHEANLKSGEMTGITDEKLEKSVSVYPNPSQGIIHIKNEDGTFEDSYTLTVLNTEGRTVFHEKSFNSKNSFNLSFLSKGLYLLNIKDNNHSVTKKLLLE